MYFLLTNLQVGFGVTEAGIGKFGCVAVFCFYWCAFGYMTELRTAKRNGGEIEMNTNNHDDFTANQIVHHHAKAGEAAFNYIKISHDASE